MRIAKRIVGAPPGVIGLRDMLCFLVTELAMNAINKVTKFAGVDEKCLPASIAETGASRTGTAFTPRKEPKADRYLS
jgi:hypothetical protein